MKYIYYVLIVPILLITSCKSPDSVALNKPIIGSWRLLSGLIIKGKDSVLTDYTRNQKMIKIITASHFAFFRHDLTNGKEDNPIFVAGGGTCVIKDSIYTENLEYFNYREWENNSFEFTYVIKGDTLITKGTERIEELAIDQFNIETFVKVK